VRRHLILPDRGVLLISTDVHGNEEDMLALEAIFREERTRERETHWVILGDVVHAPSDSARKDRPDLYDYDDGSMRIIDRIAMLEREHAGYVHFVIGNHDHGHVGGPHPAKFYGDEVEALESKLGMSERQRLHAFLERSLYAVAAPCGVLLTHGAPDDSLTDIRLLDAVPLAVAEMTSEQRRMMRALLTSYGQPEPVAKAMLANVGHAIGLELNVVVHGHDRDESGYFREGAHQLCPCLFGAPRPNKRYLRLDLAARYKNAHALREDTEVRLLYSPAAE